MPRLYYFGIVIMRLKLLCSARHIFQSGCRQACRLKKPDIRAAKYYDHGSIMLKLREAGVMYFTRRAGTEASPSVCREAYTSWFPEIMDSS